MGCVITWVTWVGELRGSVGAWVALVKMFFTWVNIYVGHDIYEGYVSQIYFCVGQFFFVLVNFYLSDEIILLYYN